MRLPLPHGKLVLTITFIAGIAAGVLGKPLWKIALMETYGTKFGEMTHLCDQAMRLHFIAKQKLAFKPSASGVQSLKAAEIGLIDCQDYDMMRKKLITLGLGENELAALSLKAIEADSNALLKVIETHEIKY